MELSEYATINLHKLGACIDGEWLYSDTDSCYAFGWNEEKLEAYNQECKDLLKKNGLYAAMWAEYQKAVNWKVGETA